MVWCFVGLFNQFYTHLTFVSPITLDLVPMPHGHDACILSYHTRIVIVLLQVVTRICFKLLSNPRLNPLCTPHIFISTLLSRRLWSSQIITTNCYLIIIIVLDCHCALSRFLLNTHPSCHLQVSSLQGCFYRNRTRYFFRKKINVE